MSFSKTALITGAAGLLGEQHCLALLQSNFRVIATDLNFKNLNLKFNKSNFTKFKSNLVLKKIDVTNEKSIQNCLKYLKQNKITLDVLINNAAIDFKPSKNNQKMLNNNRVENFSMDRWNKELDVGLKGAFLCTKYLGYYMTKNKNGGHIINISSDLSVISPNQNLYKKNKTKSDQQTVKPVTYSVIKSGLVGMTKYFATYWADYKVRCNCLSPGGIRTNQPKNFVRKLEKLIPLKRMANIDEYNEFIKFLCSDGSMYLNGQNIVVDGGRSIW